MTDPFNLERFVRAQDPVYPRVLKELRQGHKETHWMWFIFPQLKGLGSSPTAVLYAISSLEEARAYLEHSRLGPRLHECTALVNAIAAKSLDQIFGYPDNLKFHSCMELFAEASNQSEVFVTGANRR